MPLKKTEIEHFKKTLLQLRAEILGTYQDITEVVKSPDDRGGYSQHQADQGTDDFDRTISLELSNKELQILKQIDRALEKIDESSYGVCDVSGEEISKARLEAVPYATMTVQAQEKLEKGLL